MIDMPRKRISKHQPSTSNHKPSHNHRDRGRSALVANVLSLVDEWQTHRRETGDSLNAVMEAMTLTIDYDNIKPSSLRAAVAAVCAGSPTTDLVALSDYADSERTILAERDEMTIDDAKRMIAKDPQLATLIERLKPNPAALRAAATLVRALANGRRAVP